MKKQIYDQRERFSFINQFRRIFFKFIFLIQQFLLDNLRKIKK